MRPRNLVKLLEWSVRESIILNKKSQENFDCLQEQDHYNEEIKDKFNYKDEWRIRLGGEEFGNFLSNKAYK